MVEDEDVRCFVLDRVRFQIHKNRKSTECRKLRTEKKYKERKKVEECVRGINVYIYISIKLRVFHDLH